MGSRISLLCGANQATENLAQKSYLSGDIESFNVAVQNGAQLKDMEKMDKSFLEKIAQHPEISYPKKVVELAGKTGDTELTREIFRNGLKHGKTDVNTLKLAIMLDDAQTVANILEVKPWLSNQPVRVNTSEGLIPCRMITVPKGIEKASKGDIAAWKWVFGAGQAMLESHPITATVKPLDIALYKATETKIRPSSSKSDSFAKEPTNLNANLKIIESLINSGADCRNNMYGDLKVDAIGFGVWIPKFSLPNKIKPIDYAKEYTRDDVSQVISNGLAKDKKKQVEKLSRIISKENSPAININR